MKPETIKSLALGVSVGLCVMLYSQSGTQAGPGPSVSRVVPVIPQSVIPPSKMVAVGVNLSSTSAAGVVQAPINLDPGQVFVLTAVTSMVADSSTTSGTPNAYGLRAIRQGSPTGPVVGSCKTELDTGAGNYYHSTFPTGIRFGPAQNGQAALYLVGLATGGSNVPPELPDVALEGYITDDL